jgi:hypothetical protein
MMFLRRPHEMRRRDAEAFVLAAEMNAHLIDEKLRLDVLALRRLLNFLTVFVDAGQEKDIALEAKLMARKEIREDFLVRMPEVGRAVDVINRRGEEIRTGHDGTLAMESLLANLNVAAT